ncbi:GAF domain-containing protein [Streptomyces sp. NPDC088354]|uniref:GAF domain-containing protein n=1 Tax=unclassified Streptomyces TaxID=2593676 RepID=UPI0029B6BF6E|nr:GAF domain-containing protein [Streptomyces sp. MI02-7b]MDX3074018.1 GAF domain-containing protein [Streptomyces sp. MI02-7b]
MTSAGNDDLSPGAQAGAALSRRDEILRSTVRLARLVFGAPASSIFLHDAGADSLVLEATSNPREDHLLGWKIPDHSGIAGWVFQSGEAVIADDLEHNPLFNKDFAASTGLVPKTIVAAPLETAGSIFGIMEVLDPDLGSRGEAAVIELVSELARQCSAALAIAGGPPGPSAPHAATAERLVSLVTALARSDDPSAERVLSSLEEIAGALARGRG